MGNARRSPTPESMMSEALDSLHASDDLADRALAAARAGGRRRGRTHSLAAVAAIALVGTLAISGTAYAVANSDFFSRAYGNHGLGGSTTWTVDDSQGNPAHTYSRSFDTITADSAPDALAQATERIGLTMSNAGYTLTVDTMVLDANGTGAATFTLTNPNGFSLYKDAVAGELAFGLDSDLRLLGMEFADGSRGSIDAYCYYDASASTDTEIHGAFYFTTQDPEGFRDGVRWTMSVVNGSDTPDTATDTFLPSKVIGTRSFSDGDTYEASLSPLGLKLTLPTRKQAGETTLSQIALTLADGSTKRVIAGNGESTEINYYVYYGWDTDEASYQTLALSQIVDPAEVTSIELAGRSYPNGASKQEFSTTLAPKA